MRETGTQMDRPDLYQDHSNDCVIVSRPAFTAEQLHEVLANYTIKSPPPPPPAAYPTAPFASLSHLLTNPHKLTCV